jgi:hypothetical protein
MTLYLWSCSRGIEGPNPSSSTSEFSANQVFCKSVAQFTRRAGWRKAYSSVRLLDACYSGAAASDGSKLSTNADLLRSIIASSNVTVLTSSSAAEPSEEDEAWKNGAFTKVLIEALGRDADDNRNGLISMSRLIDYLSRHLPMLTGDRQHLGIDQRFQSDLFVAGL